MPAPLQFNSNGARIIADSGLHLQKLRCKDSPILCIDRARIHSLRSPVIRHCFLAIKPVGDQSVWCIMPAKIHIAPQLNESQSFLHDPINKLDTSFATSEYQPYKDNTGRQLRHLLFKSSARWFITAGLCAGYVLSTRVWVNKGAISENQKNIYNAITTAISIALGLNIASAFKDMALNMRWPILAARKRTLREVSRK
jgi:hypothetical protein